MLFPLHQHARKGHTLLMTAMEENDCPKFNPITVVTGTCGSRTTGVAVPLGARLTFLLADLDPFFGAMLSCGWYSVTLPGNL